MDNFKRTYFTEYEQITSTDVNADSTNLLDNIIKLSQCLVGTQENAIIDSSYGDMSVIPDSPSSMQVKVNIGACYRTDGSLIVNNAIKSLTIDAASSTDDRYDIIQFNITQTDTDPATRNIIDPSTKNLTPTTIYTSKQYNINLVVKKGTAGVGHAPTATVSYVKLAEIYIPKNATELTASNIYNITARRIGVNNANWTTQANTTYKIKNYLDHCNSGDHPPGSIVSSNYYDYIIDKNGVAGMNCDYTNIPDTFLANKKYLIRNGLYYETNTTVTIENGAQIIGESEGGVILVPVATTGTVWQALSSTSIAYIGTAGLQLTQNSDSVTCLTNDFTSDLIGKYLIGAGIALQIVDYISGTELIIDRLWCGNDTILPSGEWVINDAYILTMKNLTFRGMSPNRWSRKLILGLLVNSLIENINFTGCFEKTTTAINSTMFDSIDFLDGILTIEAIDTIIKDVNFDFIGTYNKTIFSLRESSCEYTGIVISNSGSLSSTDNIAPLYIESVYISKSVCDIDIHNCTSKNTAYTGYASGGFYLTQRSSSLGLGSIRGIISIKECILINDPVSLTCNAGGMFAYYLYNANLKLFITDNIADGGDSIVGGMCIILSINNIFNLQCRDNSAKNATSRNVGGALIEDTGSLINTLILNNTGDSTAFPVRQLYCFGIGTSNTLTILLGRSIQGTGASGTQNDIINVNTTLFLYDT